MTKLEIINETVLAYADPSNRGLTPNGLCCYITDDGKMCAVGRCMTDPEPWFGGITTITRNQQRPHDSFLKPQYHGHSLQFWEELQYFHDNRNFWTPTGLSDLGQQRLTSLRTHFSHESN